MTPDNVNKTIGTGILAATLAAAVYFGVAHIQPPELVTLVIGGALGVSTHMLGVVSGSSTTLKGIDTANNASADAAANLVNKDIVNG